MADVSLSTLEKVPGVMTGKEFCERAAAFNAPYLAKQARQDMLDWRGINVELLGDGKTFSVPHGWPVKNLLKAVGFNWTGDTRRWETEDPRIVARCPELVRKSKGACREALRTVLRMQNARETLTRAAAERLEPGDVERIKDVLSEPSGKAMAIALREAMGILAGYDSDKATVRNGEGFSKSDTELGHAVVFEGMKKFPDAALARNLAWKYRAQLPAHLLADIFPTVEAPPTLTIEQAQELIDFPMCPELVEDIRTSPFAIKDGTPEVETSKPPFLQESQTPVARVEGGAVLLLVKKGKKAVRLEVRAAA